MNAFFDTSAIAKRYTDEPGQEQVESFFQEADRIGVSIVCLPEVFSTLCRLQREGKFDALQYERIKSLVLQDFVDIDVCDIVSDVIDIAMSILENNTLRGMDAIHVACAIDWEADAFVSGDQRQVLAARNMGLTVIGV